MYIGRTIKAILDEGRARERMDRYRRATSTAFHSRDSIRSDRREKTSNRCSHGILHDPLRSRTKFHTLYARGGGGLRHRVTDGARVVVDYRAGKKEEKKKGTRGETS